MFSYINVCVCLTFVEYKDQWSMEEIQLFEKYFDLKVGIMHFFVVWYFSSELGLPICDFI